MAACCNAAHKSGCPDSKLLASLTSTRGLPPTNNHLSASPVKYRPNKTTDSTQHPTGGGGARQRSRYSQRRIFAAGYPHDAQTFFCLWKEVRPHRRQAVWVLVCLLPNEAVPFVCSSEVPPVVHERRQTRGTVAAAETPRGSESVRRLRELAHGVPCTSYWFYRVAC